MSHARLEIVGGRDHTMAWGRREEEFAADFLLVSKRMLTESEHQLFRFHFLLGADWKMCCRRFKVDRGTFFHDCYRVQEKLGRAFRELQPYSLFPLSEYFNGVLRAPIEASSPRVEGLGTNRRSRLHVPLRKVA